MSNVESYGKFVGQIFDNRYRILKIIGVGGMSVVFEALDVFEKRTVAIKMLRDEIAGDEQQVKRFVNESKAVAMLSHPNIVKIYNISVKSSIKFIVMELIEGITLKDYMTKRGVLSFNEVISYSEQILHALEHAHSKGVVHRDIKPQNIMLLKNGVIKVTDFGIAKIPNAESLTITDKAIGTVFYISPEQAEGKSSDQRCDLYSLGAMMYEMASGRLPFYDESPISVALMQIKNNPEPPRNINPAIPKGLEQIILSAMEKEPKLRFQSATQMLRQIARLKADPGIVFKANAKIEAARRQVEMEKNSGRIRTEKTRLSDKSMFPMILGVVSAFVVVLIVSGIVVLNALLNGDSSALNIVVPNVVGKSYSIQDDIGLPSTYYNVEIDEKYDANTEKGTILSQTPEGGIKVKVIANTQKCNIKLTVSLGAEMIILESYEGKSLRNVKLELKRLGFVCKEEAVYDDTIDKDKVCYTYPSAGQTVAVGSTVTIYYSLGKNNSGDALEVPNFVDKTETEAKNLAGTSSITLEILYVASNEMQGTVLEQSVAAGTQIAQGTIVTLTVSGGAEYVQKLVPNITGKTVEQAKLLLERVGLSLGIETKKPSDLREGFIFEQSPAPGTVITGSSVTSVNYSVSNGEYEGVGAIEFIDIDGYQVPNIVGMTVKDAKALLKENALSLGDGTTIRSSDKKGTIVSMQGGYNYDGDFVVNYEVSGGIDFPG